MLKACRGDGTSASLLPQEQCLPHICGKGRCSSLGKAPPQHPGELITRCWRPLPRAWEAFRASDIPHQKAVCRHSMDFFLCTAARNLSHLFLNHRGGLFAEQQGLEYKSGQVLNRLRFLKFFMLSDIRRLV